ncbi:MAG: alpha-hydroxy-acid oxidizing protein [Nevskiaceae bacterium]|jgi:isopentenyl diphosphate isomerase/L-lactate dehydrogenase-like FMN-dependent dehydrogenase|nr:alpha-hydroxy-acid oxidizing protein [Nevskiaceae bacterium]
MTADPRTRRQVLQWLAASPVLGLASGLADAAEGGASATELRAAAEALDVFDMQAAAEKIVPPAHWGYLQSGVDGETTLRANSTAYSKWQLVPRRFVDVSRIDMSTTLFGMQVASPVMICPIGGLRAIGPADGDIGVARAAKAKNQVHAVSTQMSDKLEDIAEARGAPLWYQLYTTNRIEATRQLVQRAQRAGCAVVAVTVDLPAGRNTVTATRLRRTDVRPCGACHQVGPSGNPQGGMATKPMFEGLDTQGLGLTSPSLNWDFIRRLKDMTTMKVVIKGIEAEEDAALAVENGADGIIVSNHGGRALESGRGTIESLPDVVRGAAGRIPVMIDGGVRRGTDVFKALALGASAVGIGRPYAWGLAAFGQAGVERVLDILNLELRLAMVGCGARSISEIGPRSLKTA